MDQQLLIEYSNLEDEFKTLEARKAALRGRILEELMRSKMDKVESEVFGSFTVAQKTTWKYTDAIEKIEERLKIAKIKEQDRGVAKAVKSEYLVYKPVV